MNDAAFPTALFSAVYFVIRTTDKRGFSQYCSSPPIFLSPPLCARGKGEPRSGGAASGLSSDPWQGFDLHASKTSVTPTSLNVPGIQVSAEVLVKVSLPALGCEGVRAHSHTATFSGRHARGETSSRSRESHWFPMYSQQLLILVISESKQVGSGLIPTTADTEQSLGPGRLTSLLIQTSSRQASAQEPKSRSGELVLSCRKQ